MFDDGDTESNLEEIFVMKTSEYELALDKEQEDWVGVVNVTAPVDCEDEYAKTIGWVSHTYCVLSLTTHCSTLKTLRRSSVRGKTWKFYRGILLLRRCLESS